MELDSIVCMDALALMQALPPQSVDAIITDVPYGVVACDWDVVIPFDAMWAGVKRVLKPRGVFVTTASEPFASHLRMSNMDWYKYDWVWEKTVPTGFLNANKQPLKWYELVLVFYSNQPVYTPQYRKGAGYKVNVNSTKSSVYGSQTDIISINDGSQYYPKDIIKFSNFNGKGKSHPTQKPVALFEYLIKTYTQPGDVVLDFCCGSGTTAVAAVKCGRRYICGDSSPEYVALAQKRLQDTNPYEPTQVDDTHTQLSLFGGDK